MDIEKALLDPSSEFATLEDLLRDKSLTREQKIQILHRWEYDARELEVAEEENMSGGPPSMLAEIFSALRALGCELDVEHSPPTKQGGE